MNALAPMTARHDQRPPATLPPSSPADGERRARLRLASTDRVGPVTFVELLRRYGSALRALAEMPRLARDAGLRTPPRTPADAEIDREVTALADRGGRMLVMGDPFYPPALAAIADAPPVLRCIGDPALLQRPMVAIVGARNASANGRRIAADIARGLGEAGVIVVSGLARGIDTEAHRSSLEVGTVAVLAGGVDVVYPPENAGLHAAIAEGGLLLSEMPLGSVPQARHFPRRNRIIAGLAAGVVVIEAALQSGSLITAHCAVDQGREVLAVPGSPLDPRSRGCNKLLREGARLVESAQDVLAEIWPSGVPRTNTVTSYEYREPVSQAPRYPRQATRRTSPKASLEAASDSGEAFENTEKSANSSDHERVLDCLGPAPTAVDELVRRCQVSAAGVQAILLELELSGRLERHRGNAVSLL